MPLVKMKIRNLDTDEAIDDQNVRVLFNPTEYTIEQSNSWDTQNVQGGEPRTQFTKADLRKLAMELFFDSYEEKDGEGQSVDVRKYTDRVARLMTVSVDDGDGKRPPIIEVSWGNAPTGLINPDFPFKGVLLSLRQQFVLFTEQGFPVRAKLNISVQEYLTPEEIEERFPRRGSYPAQSYTVTEGDTLSGIAQALWKKPLEWRRIAQTNNIQDPRVLIPGSRLTIPPIK
ncbi:MAG: LysM domain-containing protein [Deltaproteobacteria bacterium]|jgi:hypothetical protein|nr:LysM domain-containing protein [Deltaproteobacteria bacterium]